MKVGKYIFTPSTQDNTHSPADPFDEECLDSRDDIAV